MYPGSMDSEEIKILKARKLDYYRKEGLRILLDIVPAKKP